jgi:hypothetical protein
MLKKLAQILTFALPLALLACGDGTEQPTPPEATLEKKINCAGSYVGTIDAPSLEVRLAAFQEWLRSRGIDDYDFATYPEDRTAEEGIWLEGSFAFETDANCKVVKGGVNIYNAYPYNVEGTVKADRSFDMVWTGLNVTAPIVGQINADDTISGQVKVKDQGAGYIYGLLNGKFTPNGKI